MSIFDRIKSSIFGKAEAAEPSVLPQNAPPPAGPVSTAAPAPASTMPTPQPSVTPGVSNAAPAPASATAVPNAGAAQSSTAQVDVAAIMDKAVKDSRQKLEWRKSVVDMLKALHLDSSLSERKELAKELGYTGDSDDSATMNVWLHKALMKKLAENGGTVPAELTD